MLRALDHENRNSADQERSLLLVSDTAAKTLNVLFLCTGNSARSIVAEAILNDLGRGRLKGFSAGSHPAGKVNPFALELLRNNHLPTEGLRSKSWDEFAQAGAPFMHFVFTVCDQAAAEVCPIWPGKPVTAHWGVADPAAAQGSDEDKRRGFLKAYTALHRRIALFTSLPLDKLEGLSLKEKIDEIGRTKATESDRA
jgi:protein-tyrosine-phosphatase